jgi:hypothetical protein
MTRMQLSRWQLPLSTALALLTGVIFTACCPQPPKPPEPAKNCPRGAAPSNQAELDACKAGLAFDTEYEASDEQPLSVITRGSGPACPGDTTHSLTCSYGPLAKIEPVIGAHRYSEDDLREGRIIARISVDSSETQEYRKYGLKPGRTTYWWVKIGPTQERDSSYFVTDPRGGKMDAPVARKLVRTIYERGTRLYRAIARWIWSLDDETAKGPCGAAKCT